MKRLLIIAFFVCVTPLFAQSASHSVALTWTASTTTNVGYMIFRGTAAGQESTTSLTAGPTAVNCSGATCTYTDVAGLIEGTTYFYTVKAVNMTTNALSVASNEVSGMIPIVITIPNPPSGLTIIIK
jgi:hypothetical protein